MNSSSPVLGGDRDGRPALRVSISTVVDDHPVLGRTTREIYRRVLEEMMFAERLGYFGYFVAEHHFSNYGLVPCPPALLSAAAMCTTRLRLGVAVATLGFMHPVAAAEAYATVDVLSGGRLALGVGSGYLTHEFEGFGVDMSCRRERFYEALDAFLAAWSGQPGSYSGRHIRCETLTMAVQPVQQPRPPIWMAALTQETAERAGRAGYHLMVVPYASLNRLEDLAAFVGGFRAARAAAGHGAGEVAAAMHLAVGETARAARVVAEPAFDLYMSNRSYSRRGSLDSFADAGLALFGDTSRVADSVLGLNAMGVDHVMVHPNFGGLPFEVTKDMMVRFVDEVLPKVADHVTIANDATP